MTGGASVALDVCADDHNGLQQDSDKRAKNPQAGFIKFYRFYALPIRSG